MTLRLDEGVLSIDSRVGSRELAPILKRKHLVNVRLEQLQFGDLAFIGQGKDGAAVKIAIERKTLGDLCGSLLKNRLFGHQIPGLLESYDLTWVIVEGLWRRGDDDIIEVFEGGGRGWQPSGVGLSYSGLNEWLTNYDVMGNGRLKRWRTSTLYETAAWVAALFRWWQKPWHRHSAHKALGKWRPGIGEMQGVPEKILMSRPTDMLRMVAAIPGLGSVKARKMSKHFASALDVFQASEDELIAAGLNKKAAAQVYVAIRKRYR